MSLGGVSRRGTGTPCWRSDCSARRPRPRHSAWWGSAQLGGVKPRQILEILAVAAGAPVAKDHLADVLWDGRPPRSYLGTLESYVCVLRRSLGLARGRGSAIATVNHGYVLDPAVVRIDLVDFRTLVRAAATAEPAVALGKLEEAVGWSGATCSPARPMPPGRSGSGRSSRARWWRRPASRPRMRWRSASSAWRCGCPARPSRATRSPRRRGGCSCRRSGPRAGARRRCGPTSSCGTRSSRSWAPTPRRRASELYLEILRDGDSVATGVRVDGRDEVRMLMRLLRQAVASIPGLEEPRSDRALAEVAASLVGAA